jgi:GNAT superfamily N-acetyltransferase
MLDLADIVLLEERRQCQGLRAIAAETREFADGLAGRDRPGHWANVANGAGLTRPVDAAELRDVIAWYERDRIQTRIEVPPTAHATLLSALAAERFVIVNFENVFCLEIRADHARGVKTPAALPQGVRIVELSVRDDAAVRAAAMVAVSCFVPASVPRDGDDYRHAVATSEKVMRQPECVTFVAMDESTGEAVGCGTMAVHIVPGRDERNVTMGALFGAGVLASHRRRGIQQALIASRVRVAAERGAVIATIGSRPGVGTERNVRRMGFGLAYTKAVVARQGEGLIGVMD